MAELVKLQPFLILAYLAASTATEVSIFGLDLASVGPAPVVLSEVISRGEADTTQFTTQRGACMLRKIVRP